MAVCIGSAHRPGDRQPVAAMKDEDALTAIPKCPKGFRDGHSLSDSILGLVVG
jgi:hypothetical protein